MMNKGNVVQSISKLNLDELHILVKIQRDLHNYDTAEAKATIQQLITDKLELAGELYKLNK
jgi:hypothetical protein|tara:strand:+ start:4749 stop:4931 length:183 start_codon:yes stop_codon:yes gene_type:complete